MPLVLFSSPKGGVGKTTLAAHVAAILTQRGYRVLALDLDPQNALRLHLGLSIREESGFLASIVNRSDWRECIVSTPSGVRLLPFGGAEPLRALELGAALLADPEILAGPVREMLAEPGQVLVVDSPPGPSASVSALMGLADLNVVVLLSDMGSASLVPELTRRSYGRGTLGSRAIERSAVVLNQVDLGNPLSAEVLNSVAPILGPRLLGAVCHDEALPLALAERKLHTRGEAGAAEDLKLLADAVAARLKLTSVMAHRGSYSALADWGLA